MSSPVKGPFCTVWWCLQCVSTRDMLHSWVRFRLPKPQWGTVKGYLLHNHSLSWYIKRHPSSEPAGWAHPVQVRRGCGHSKPETSHLFLTGTKASHISHGWSSGWVEIRDILLFDSLLLFFLNTRTTHKQRCITGFCFKGSTLWSWFGVFLKVRPSCYSERSFIGAPRSTTPLYTWPRMLLTLSIDHTALQR